VIAMCKKIAIDCSKISQWASNSTTGSSFGNYSSSDYGTGYNDVFWRLNVSVTPTGTVEGIARCTESSSDYSTPSSSGRNCWCRMTGQDGNNACLCGSWVFLSDWGSASDCAYICADDCAFCVLNGTLDSCSRAAVLSLP
jgi:hypothetical protein